ncbi:EAL domain-containing protein [Solirubrobacter ginsenosidimutans]|uniref:EAL domain-containing protein n=1 Tax=Solirubrobacter ginsenosidimutans TaxID=490573 RepID=A0A9X3S8R3_9ACTN|nr:bifunctional diguanylate cyclase/phosphodiesterase [Solirubrobacter ginsenosidimutans]MDA0167266.1 EAL domain-containing protein [Solirubrobacter ginsenosidimutans]
MAARLEDLSPAELDHIEQSRVRAGQRAERRELLTEFAVSSLVVVAATAMALLAGHERGGAGTLVWMAALCAVLAQIQFEVGEGYTRPIQLVFVPMLLLLSPGLVPLAILLAHLPVPVLRVVRGDAPLQRLLPTIADCAFSLAPALVILVAGVPDGLWSVAAVCLLALGSMVVSDLAVSSLRMRVGLGMDPRAELRGFAWVYLIDFCLAPIGFFAALAARGHPAMLAGVLPIAGLLVIFARERRGRIANAMALQQVAQESRDRLQSIVQNSSDCIVIVDARATMTALTGSVRPIFGPDWERAQGGRLLERVHPDDVPLVCAFLESVAGKPADEPQAAEWRMRYADGSHRHIAAMATNLLGDPRVAGIVITASDVEDRKAFEEQLRHRAFHDALTGLANRALFYDRIEHALGSRPRAAAEVAVLFVDLDDFKAANDARGHSEGDRLLQEAARRLTACLRSSDTAARLGGDEFGVLIEGVTDPATATAAAARILDALGHPIELTDGPISISASIGIAVSAGTDRGVEEFLRKADLAMYEAKRNGKHRAELFHAGLERLGAEHGPRGQWFARDDEQRAEIEDVLQDPDAIRMVFQPIIDLRTGRIAGYESLARFSREPRRGPDVWFAQAHRCGLGYELEAKAIACALATPDRPRGTYLTFNLSPSSLLADDVLRVLPARLDGLVVEITENELVSGDAAITAALDDLRARGARLAVDDTGAGYAGLTHVMRLQPDIIKLDRALTSGVDHDPAKAPLISSFVRYARDIDADVCAEGIETRAELECLADLDVAYGQGYGIARPSPPWTGIAPDATAACLRAFETTLADTNDSPARADHDRRLEILVRRLAEVTTAEELHACLGPLADELGADEVRLVEGSDRQAGQLLVDDPTADARVVTALRSEGYASRLSLPVHSGGHVIAHLEAYARQQRPWSRFQVGRARLVCYQLGPLLTSLHAATVGSP